jgi:hypothetical protein
MAMAVSLANDLCEHCVFFFLFSGKKHYYGNMHWVMTHVSCEFCLFWAFERDGLTYLYMYVIHCLQLV